MNPCRSLPALAVLLAISPAARAQEAPASAAVSFASPTPNVRFKAVRVDGTPAAQDASLATVGCVAPCGGALSRGRYAFSLSRDGDEPKVAGQASIVGPSTVEGSYVSRSSMRLAGWITLAAGVAGGITLGALSVHRTVSCATPTGAADAASIDPGIEDGSCPPSGHRVDGVMLGAGIGVLVVGAVLGTWMIRRSDEVSFRVVPVVASMREGSGPRATVEGLTLQATF